jgi:ppGpp synthetase/RelA/SpoT-type nucleotidyltranferase
VSPLDPSMAKVANVFWHNINHKFQYKMNNKFVEDYN